MFKKNKIVIITGDDYVSKFYLGQVLAKIKNVDGIVVLLDRSTNFKRLFAIIKKGRVSPIWLGKVMIARVLQTLFLLFFRKSAGLKISPQYIKSNDDLSNFLNENDVDKIYCFRAGLVINKHNVNKANFINIHCAKIPKYAGLMSIAKALNDGDYNQQCVMHKVVEAIDSGEILKTRDYKLNKNKLYWLNELTAYSCGAEILASELNECCD